MSLLSTAGLYFSGDMAPNFKKMKAFSQNGTMQEEGDDLESGQFLPETQNTYANVDIAAPKKGGQYTDEYRA